MSDTTPVVRHISEVEPVPCPCGTSTRVLTAADNPTAGLHVTHIIDAQTHYHKLTTELYYVIDGEGTIMLDGDEQHVKPGSAIMIPPRCRHAGRGNFKAVIVTVPAFQPGDEYFDPTTGEDE